MHCEHPREVKDSSFNAFLNEDRSFIISWWALKESEAAFFFEGRPELNFFFQLMEFFFCKTALLGMDGSKLKQNIEVLNILTKRLIEYIIVDPSAEVELRF